MGGDVESLLDAHWRLLASRSTSESPEVVAVSELSVASALGHLAVAVDDAGRRHLLVPIGPHQDVRRGVNGPVLTLRKRPLDDGDVRRVYADLACLRTDLNDLFATLCTDIVAAVECGGGTNPLKAMNGVLTRWKSLLQSAGPPLGAQQLAGLFGELTVLQRLLERNGGAHLLWRGPSGSRHDFAADENAIEVKTSTTSTGREVRIHGLDQLDAPNNGTLGLAWIRLDSADESGDAFLDLIDRVLELADDEAAVLEQLAQVGYRRSDDDHYRNKRFVIAEQRWYKVDVSFPRLTTETLAAVAFLPDVRDVSYTIDLAGDAPEPMTEPEIEDQIRSLVEESA